ncbi:hypothetical protein BKA83DRAFT_4496475 [Pisolithus microcarpus]|nr:hypothetical protein BKA83DRAFT_4499311 [Pisolithus microcarpus]KAI6018113.1 hypothetical protein BKA83DRAFT_4496475 [Pisolithus microcarpus]
MPGTQSVPSHPWASDGEYNFSGLSATMECGSISQPNGDVGNASPATPVVPSFHTPGMVPPLCPVVPSTLINRLDPDNTICNFLNANTSDPWISSFSPHQPTVNWAPPPSLSSTVPVPSLFSMGDHGCLGSDSQVSSGSPRLPSTTQQASSNAESVSERNGSGSGATGSFIENVEDRDRPGVPTEGTCDVSTWATHNPGARIIQPHRSRQISEAQRASWAIARERRAAKKALLDKAVQEYLAQQTTKMEEIAFKHNVTVEYLKGLVGGETHYHSSQKVQRHNALLHAKALEVNADRPCGTKYSLKEIQQMVKDDERLQNLSQEEMDQYVSTLEEHCNMKTHGVRANNLNGLRNHTGIYATLLVTHGHINDSIQSTWTTTDNSAEFWEDVFGHQIADIARQYEQWACTQNQNFVEHDSLGSLCKQITKAVSSGLEKITHKKNIVMNYHNYETAIVETYGVRLVGWPEGVKFANPSVIGTVVEARKLCDALRSGSCFWKRLSKNELDLFVTELNNAGITRKCKAPIGSKENVQAWKKAHSSHRRNLPKSVEFISTSDKEDSEEA